MAFSAHKNPDQLLEHEMKDNELQQIVKQIAEKIKQSKHVIAFTGAGISTSAGIPDFRGPQGVWTLRAQGKSMPKSAVDTLCAIPTATHMALLALQQNGILKALISQNCDGLHRRSGFPPENLFELHGNSNLEYCSHCNVDFMRDYHVRRRGNHVNNHETDSSCPQCGNKLKDTIINFGEDLPSLTLEQAFQHAESADFCLALGSSLTVTPAKDIPKIVGKRDPSTFVICNLQKTPLDKVCGLRVFAKTDRFMNLLMKELKIEIPNWVLRRRMFIKLSPCKSNSKNCTIIVSGLDHNNREASIIQSCQLECNSLKKPLTSSTEPHSFNFPASELSNAQVKLYFYGHYNEPALSLKLKDYLVENKTQVIINILYRLNDPQWHIESVQ